ncbi:MAG: hypothetical protein LBR33_02010 [Propionibacteriaceae bacterium]|jgi:hypothetical protein|nr:hypothetical protein [Propionibacteriaceae bacterium]
MAEDARRLVLDTLEFASPQRAPRHVWDVAWTYQAHPAEIAALKARFPEDIAWAPPLFLGPTGRQGDPYAVGWYTDEWGCRFENKFAGIIGEVKAPPVVGDDWEEMMALPPPDGILRLDTEAINAFCRAQGKFTVATTTVRLFERLQFLAGTEKTLIDLLLRPAGFDRAVDQVHAFFCEELAAWAETAVDALFVQDDWGTQQSLLASPALFREIFKPRYREYADIAHAHGKKLFMHSDGKLLDIMEDLVDIGVDALNSQIFVSGVENLAPYAGRITFWGEIDRQGLLPFGSLADIDAAVRLIRDTLWRDGGCIAQCDFGIGVKPENVLRVFEAWAALEAAAA